MEFSKQNQENSVWNEIEQKEAGTLFNIAFTKIERMTSPTKETAPTKDITPTKEKVKRKKKVSFS
jgi:hypothetical protein